MDNIVINICKKELKTRFGSKKTIIPLIISLGIPMLVFIPKLHSLMFQLDPETEYIRFLLFLLIPNMVTTLVGITSFINEIRWNTIKPLLVAPISDSEILIGKSLACIFMGLITELSLAGLIFLSVDALDLSTIMLLFLIGPLSVILTTLIFIMGVSRFPTISDTGGAVLLPMIGLLTIFMIFFSLKVFLKLDPVFLYLFLALIISVLIFVTFLITKRIFNREKLILSI